jgi:hypothetical protein
MRIVEELRRLASAMEPDDAHEEVDPDSAMLNEAADTVGRLAGALRKLGNAHAEVCPSKDNCATLEECLNLLRELEAA